MERLGILGNVFLYRILAAIFFVVGVLYIFFPQTMKKIDEAGKKLLWKEEFYLVHRLGFGIFFFVVGILMCYVGFVVLKR